LQSNEPLKAILIGAGNRGKDVYGEWALKNPKKLKFVALAEPNPIRRKLFSKAHSIPQVMQFNSWERILNSQIGKLAEIAFIATQDQLHTKPALEALNLGYNVLLEKPMATSLNECKLLVKNAEEQGRQLRIAHVLRYTRFFNAIKETIRSGRIGRIITIDHRENVSYFHYAHSYVRGNWAKESISSPMILAKSCHDLDLLYWFIGEPAFQISSFGSLSYFCSENAPSGATKRCTDGCPVSQTCKYYAPRIYIDIIPLLHIVQVGGSRRMRFQIKTALNRPWLFRLTKKLLPFSQQLTDYKGWPVNTITEDLSLEGKWKALKTGPYGRCVYYCDNDVVDHQVTIIRWKNGITATFTMHGFSHAEGRTIRIDGTEGSLIGESLLSGSRLVFYNHQAGTKEIIIEEGMTIDPESGHGGGDCGLIQSFIDSINGKKGEEPLTSAKASLESHLMAFAAEESRISNTLVNIDIYR
jgi:predicted dehydrogenase